jgi:hypothetical protein
MAGHHHRQFDLIARSSPRGRGVDRARHNPPPQRFAHGRRTFGKRGRRDHEPAAAAWIRSRNQTWPASTTAAHQQAEPEGTNRDDQTAFAPRRMIPLTPHERTVALQCAITAANKENPTSTHRCGSIFPKRRPCNGRMRHVLDMEAPRRHSHDQAIVEIAYVTLSSVVILVSLIAVEWVAWWSFSLTSPMWRVIGYGVLVVVALGLAKRAAALLRRPSDESAHGCQIHR